MMCTNFQKPMEVSCFIGNEHAHSTTNSIVKNCRFHTISVSGMQERPILSSRLFLSSKSFLITSGVFKGFMPLNTTFDVSWGIEVSSRVSSLKDSSFRMMVALLNDGFVLILTMGLRGEGMSISASRKGSLGIPSFYTSMSFSAWSTIR